MKNTSFVYRDKRGIFDSTDGIWYNIPTNLDREEYIGNIAASGGFYDKQRTE